MLEVAQLSCAYGKHQALADVSLDVGRGQIVAVLGANGAGKSTLLKAIAGLVEPAPGAHVSLDGDDLVGLPAHRIVERGVAIVPEGRGIFGDLTVRENLLLGAYPARARAAEAEMMARVLGLFPRLTERLTQAVNTMSGGEQQMVAIGRALMSNPDCLLLDEPSLGLSPLLSRELFRALLDVRSAGVGILLVEQNARAALDIADRAYLISGGRNAGSGTAAALKSSHEVQRAYLGGAATSVSMEIPMTAVSMLIGGKDEAASGRRTFERLNPVTGKTASVVAAASVEDALRAADAAAKAFAAWSRLGPSERRHRLNAAADVLARRAPEFVALMTAETGATAAWAGFNVHLAEGMLREAAAMTTQIAGEVIPTDKPDNLAMAFRQPVGVVLGIAPWNAPVILGVRAVAMPLACGNTVVLKASEMSPGVHRLIGTCLAEAGLGDGVVNVVTNAPADAETIVEALIAHPAVRRVNFTGSTRVGRLIAVACARHLKRVLLELGGKAPLVVLDDADLDAAVDAAAFGAFMNQGQICMSTERIVVDDKVADAFVAKFAAKAKSLPHGDPRKDGVVLGALVSKAASERVAALIQDALAKGAKLAAGGPGDGVLMPATIVDHVTSAMRLYGDESFAPIAAVVRVGGIEEAVRVANDTEYGLSSAVFGRDFARAMSVAKRLETGICHINAPTVHDEPQMPFGGVKASGYGRFGGRTAIDEFTELRWITVQTGPHHYPF